MFYINNNGSLLDEEFKSESDAQKFIDAQDDEDAYLMKVVELDQKEKDWIEFLEGAFDSKTAKLIFEKEAEISHAYDIQLKESLLKDSENLGVTAHFAVPMYVDYVTRFVNQPWEFNEFMNFDKYRNYLRKELDFFDNNSNNELRTFSSSEVISQDE